MQNNFRIDSIFHQVGYSFDIPLEIHQELIREIDLKLKSGEISLFGKEEYSLFVIVNTGKEVKDLAIKKSYQSQKERYLEYVIYIPFDAVTKNESQTIMTLTYLEYLSLGLEKILAIYKADTKVIEDIFRNTKSKVLHSDSLYH
ncbi:hypothetical protein [Flectobacillus sp. BAB-3569]|uniref:hypothetical protein n=1 Tax=Flectobacillus sp. BAB-3569 TaxID=1509483 RepID=UPI000BA30F26|nr:hypothetical protein [Flectobacillus sp. BAB-3569]PAC28676.1 hypothetical protein BWI92_19030 [Flectobacillus sp. BAB-3569]